MPPVGPLRKDDGPACRVCGCTEHNACPVDSANPHKPAFPGGPCGCSWVSVPDSPRYLCSACSGSYEDGEEALSRATGLLQNSGGSKKKAAAVVLSLRGRLLERRKQLMRS